ncbi:MAG TPA: hypothetical protein DCZ04_14385 [Syntrophorhabdus aromaticivorans]|nr:hypothetical protein [Syntrophorhabdus aromaticivorans]
MGLMGGSPIRGHPAKKHSFFCRGRILFLDRFVLFDLHLNAISIKGVVHAMEDDPGGQRCRISGVELLLLMS